MTETKTKPAKYELLTNVPVTVEIKYVDVWPDNGYGSQVSIKGIINGETQTIYLKGKSWANLKALAEAGVIAGYAKEDEEPAEKVNLPVVNGSNVTLCRRQLAGERFANLIVETPGKPSHTPGTPSVPGKSVSVKPDKPEPREFGAIPGLDDVDDELPPVEEAFSESAAPTANGAKLAALFKLYDTCYEYAAILARRHGDLAPDVSAMAATIFIQANNRGISL